MVHSKKRTFVDIIQHNQYAEITKHWLTIVNYKLWYFLFTFLQLKVRTRKKILNKISKQVDRVITSTQTPITCKHVLT